jgi:uncharacterized repeat protein (TIGR01451 family)
MSRKVSVLIGLVVLGGFVVAIVQGQESSRRTATPFSGTPATSGTSGLSPTPAPPPARSTSRFDGEDAESGSTTFSGKSPVVATPAAPAVSAGQPGSLADRLQAIRKSVTSEYSTDNATPAPAISSGTPVGSGLPSVLKKDGAAGGYSPAPATPLSSPSDVEIGGSSNRTMTLSPSQPVESFAPVQARPTFSAPTQISQQSRSQPQTQLSAAGDIRLSSRGPALRVEAIGPAAIVIGKQATYQVLAANQGDIEARDMIVSVDLPAWVQIVGSDATIGAGHAQSNAGGSTRVEWEIDRLAAGADARMNLTVTPSENRPFDLQLGWTFTPPTSTAKIEVQQPRLEMNLAGPKDVLYGDTSTYTITLMNPGTGDAENVEFTLTSLATAIDAPETKRVGTIPAGSEKTVQVQLTARQAGQMEIRATATADGGLKAEAAEQVLVRRANLQIAMSGPRLKYAGTDSSYQLRVSNNGNATADDVIAAIALPPGVKLTAAAEGGKQAAGGVMWSLGKLPPGTERVLGIDCELITAGDIRIEAGVRAAGDLTAADAVATKVESLADLKMEVSDPQGPQPVGDVVKYRIRIVNRGTKAARQVNVIGQFSEGIEPVSADGARADLVPGQVLFQPIAQIDAGAELILTVTARADKNGNHTFRTELKCSDPETRLLWEGTTRFFGDDAPRTTTQPSLDLSRQPAPAQKIEVKR